ncbi:MAG: hypothetical protein HRT88_10910, partial [Lentisphaeraceae bacterium]|nr:hypothetical protein [Lentisphaeraceae bacterium]
VRVQGGIARSYYMEIAHGDENQLICIMPRDTNEGVTQQLSGMRFKVMTNEALKFPVHSSATRLGDKLGKTLEGRDEISELPPLITSLQYGKSRQSIEVEVHSVLNETGTLEISLNSIGTDHSWQLKFDMRALHNQSDDAQKASSINQASSILVSDDQVKLAMEAIDAVFIANTEKPGKLIKKLEEVFEMNRNEWSLQLIRQLADYLLKIKDEARKKPALEARWMNLTGFCLRPGFGDTSDDFRIKQLWSMWFQGPNSKTDAQTSAEWWVLWRRISGGLNAGRQEQVAHTLMKSVMPNDSYKKNTKHGNQDKMESWRCLASLERLPLKIKRRISSVQAARITKLEDYELWVMARLHARHLFYGPVDLSTSNKDASFIAKLLKEGKKGNVSPMTLFALSRICAKSGNHALDINDQLRAEIMEFMQSQGALDSQVQHVKEVRADSAEESKQLLGDSLPIGLQLHD